MIADQDIDAAGPGDPGPDHDAVDTVDDQSVST